jgi:hypothetical protein
VIHADGRSTIAHRSVDATLPSAYDRGYAAGYEAGREQGESDGYDHGHERGYDEGYDSGRGDGYESGLSDGYDDGWQQGYDEGSQNEPGILADSIRSILAELDEAGLQYVEAFGQGRRPYRRYPDGPSTPVRYYCCRACWLADEGYGRGSGVEYAEVGGLDVRPPCAICGGPVGPGAALDLDPRS